MASEIRVNKINSLSGVGTVTLSPTGVDIAGITTAATLRATTGIITSLTAGSLTSLGDVTVNGDELFIADSIKHIGDTDTLISFPSNDTIKFNTAGSERFRIDSSGLIANNARVPSSFGSPNLLISGTDSTLTLMGDGSTNSSSFTGIKFRVAGSSAGDYTKAGIFSRREGGYNDLSLIFALDTVADATSVSIADEKMRITSGGNVNIGTTSSFNSARLSVTGGLNGTHAVFSGQASRGLKISTENTVNNDDGVAYDAQTSTGKHLFKVAGSEKMRITSSGLVGIGTINPQSAQLQVVGGQSYSQINISSNKTVNANKTTGITWLNYQNNATALCQAISLSNANVVYYGSADSNSRGITKHSFYTNSNSDSTSGHTLKFDVESSDVSISNADLVFKTAGRGVVLGATSNSDANTLDDYEEGSWTPAWGAGGSATGLTNASGCTYVKIGELVHVRGRITLTGTSGNVSTTDGWYITGLPYANTDTHGSSGSWWMSSSWTGGTRATGVIMAYATSIYFGTEYTSSMSRDSIVRNFAVTYRTN